MDGPWVVGWTIGGWMDDGWMDGPSVNGSFGPHSIDLSILGSLLEPQEGSPHTVSSISHVDPEP